jgi:hypothetical protein
MFSFVFVSKIEFCFQKVVFTRDIAMVSWEDKSIDLFALADYFLQMFKGAYDVFALMINFLGNDW